MFRLGRFSNANIGSKVGHLLTGKGQNLFSQKLASRRGMASQNDYIKGNTFLEANAERIKKIAENITYRQLGNTGLRVSELSYGTWVTFGNQVT